MQFVRELQGRKFYNDSKATNTLRDKKCSCVIHQADQSSLRVDWIAVIPLKN